MGKTKENNTEKQCDIGYFTVDDAKEVVTAWESLEGNKRYTPKEIERWLANDMKPVIDKIKAKINVL